MKFGTHIKLHQASDENSLEQFLASLSPVEKLDLIRDRDSVYPLPKSPDPKRVKDMSEKYNLYTNILNMSLGQFIMLENELRSENGDDAVIASLVIRPKDEISFDNEDHDREDSIIESICNEHTLDVYSVVLTMMLNRDFILFSKFSGVIYNRVDEREEEPEEVEDEKTDSKIDDEAFNAQWFWYKIVRDLAMNDITRLNEIYELKMSVVMVELAYKAQKGILENARARAEEARQRALYRR